MSPPLADQFARIILRIVLILLLLSTLLDNVRAQTPPTDWQREATRQFPDLAVPTSALNKLFRAEYDRLKTTTPDFFRAPNWPVLLATRCSEQLATQNGASPKGPAAGTPPKGAFPTREWNDLARSFAQRQDGFSWQAYLTKMGVAFPAGATASYDIPQETLTVGNTKANLDLIDTIMAQEKKAAGADKIGFSYYEIPKVDGIKVGQMLAVRDEKGEVPQAALEEVSAYLEHLKSAKPLVTAQKNYPDAQRSLEDTKSGQSAATVEFEPVANGGDAGPQLALNLVAKTTEADAIRNMLVTSFAVPIGGRTIFLFQADLDPKGSDYVLVTQFADTWVTRAFETLPKAGIAPGRFAITIYEFPKAAAKQLDGIMVGTDPKAETAACAFLDKLSGAKKLYAVNRSFRAGQVDVGQIGQGDENISLTFLPLGRPDALPTGEVEVSAKYGSAKMAHFEIKKEHATVPPNGKILIRVPQSQQPDKDYAIAVEYIAGGK